MHEREQLYAAREHTRRTSATAVAPEPSHRVELAVPRGAHGHLRALARLDRGLAGDMLLRLQRGHGNAYCSRLVRHTLTSPAAPSLQRDGTKTQPRTSGVPDIKGKPDAKLSPREAVHQLELKLLAEGGLFSTLQRTVGSFKDDMKTELGWYAGDKKASSKKKTGVDAATDAAVSAAKSKAKEAITTGLKYLASQLPRVGGPAGTAAAAVAGVLWKEFDKIADYDPVVTEVARKAPHQHYIEAMEMTLAQASRSLMEPLTANEDELAAGSIDEIISLIAAVDSAIKEAEKRFYMEVVQGYMAVAPAKTVELETPHARWSGEKRGLWGGGTYVTPIKSGTIYIEFDAQGASPVDIKFVRTVVPELPSTVLASLNDSDPSLTLGWLAGVAQVVMEGKAFGGQWQVRIVREAGTSKLVPADSPSYTKQYLSEVAASQGARDRQSMEAQAFSGAVIVYAKLIGTPLRDAKLSA